MVGKIEFVTSSDLVAGLQELLNQLEKHIGLREPIKMFIAGGMATHLYTQDRVTTDVDAEFSKRILLPRDVVVWRDLAQRSPTLKAGRMARLRAVHERTGLGRRA